MKHIILKIFLGLSILASFHLEAQVDKQKQGNKGRSQSIQEPGGPPSTTSTPSPQPRTPSAAQPSPSPQPSNLDLQTPSTRSFDRGSQIKTTPTIPEPINPEKGKDRSSRVIENEAQIQSPSTDRRTRSTDRKTDARTDIQNFFDSDATKDAKEPGRMRKSEDRKSSSSDRLREFFDGEEPDKSLETSRSRRNRDVKRITSEAEAKQKVPFESKEEIGKEVRRNVSQRNRDRDDWFNKKFWDKHHYHPPYYKSRDNWWKWATVYSIGNWLGWRITPIYYGYYYEDDGYYWGPEGYPVTVFDYPTQSRVIDTTVVRIEEVEKWMPLGVFALTKEDKSTTSPTIFLQLALSPKGLISGTYYDSSTNQTLEIEGLVAQETQRAAWKVVEKGKVPIMETGIYNLTQSEAPIRIHFPDGSTQDALLIRLDNSR
ncbi:MAG: hypothetical protein Tsb0021_13240 [Chlamydiales bacterium]